MADLSKIKGIRRTRKLAARPGARNALARRARDHQRLKSAAGGTRTGEADARSTAAGRLPGLMRLWREDRAVVLSLVLPFLGVFGYVLSLPAAGPKSLAEMIAQMPSISLKARGDAVLAVPFVIEVAAGGAVRPSAETGPQLASLDMASGAEAVSLLSPALPDTEAGVVTPEATIAAVDQEVTDAIGRGRACTIEEAAALAQSVRPLPEVSTQSTDEHSFGVRLAAAAEAQTGDFVVYTDRYRNLSYPMGDVSALYGVCTDVIIRAYRVLGIDLQEAVRQSRVGSGDPSIDHRRTEILRRFFAKAGADIEPTTYAEDYKPGDIVTYYRPQNAGSQSHIAIVTNRVNRNGRPLIVHNRGWGPQIEDALFVDRITGHYRYKGEPLSQAIVQGKLPPLKVLKKAKRSGKAHASRGGSKSKFRTAANKRVGQRRAERQLKGQKAEF